MLVEFKCPHCGVTLEAEAAASGGQAACPGCEALLLVPPPDIRPGTTVGGFYIERKLGSGSMGEVYLATQISIDRKVALKILPPGMVSRPEQVERFLHEARLAGSIEHPNMVAVHDAGEDSGVYYLAMSYVRGVTIDDLLKARPLEEKQALEVASKVAGALAYAWGKLKLLHRDIKPANIMVDADNEVKLLDMGLAKRVEVDAGLTQVGLVVGTPSYMSPEQADPLAEVDFRTDMYSLGATLFHMVIGRRPYPGDSAAEVLRKSMKGKLPCPQELNSELSEPASALIMKMMAKRPSDRFVTWEACIEAIERVLVPPAPEPAPVPLPAAAPPSSAPAPPAPPPVRSLSRRKHPKSTSKSSLPLVLASCVAFLVVAGVVTALVKLAGSGSAGNDDTVEAGDGVPGSPAAGQGSAVRAPATGWGSGGSAPDPARIPSPALLERLEAQVTGRLEALIESPQTRSKVWSGLGLSGEPGEAEEPVLPYEQVEAAVQSLVKRAVREEYPPSLTEDIREEAETKFRVYERGEKVSLVLRGGRGVRPRAQGTYGGMRGDYVLVGSRRIVRQDIALGDMVHFDPELAAMKKDEFVVRKMRDLTRRKAEFTVAKRGELAPQVFSRAGYVEFAGNWMAPEAAFAAALAQEQNAARDAVRRDVYAKAGLERADGRWVYRPGAGPG